MTDQKGNCELLNCRWSTCGLNKGKYYQRGVIYQKLWGTKSTTERWDEKNEEVETNEEEETSGDESDDDEDDVELYTNRVLHNLSLLEVDKLLKSLKKEDLLKTVLVRERQRDFHPLISLMDAHDVVCVNANRAMSMRSIVTQVRPKTNNGSTDVMQQS